ncbi:MAG TPA: MFS transporter [Actinocrinis sp.]
MPATRSSGPIVAVLASAGIVVSLMTTLLVPILPQLSTLLRTSEANASWTVTSTLLAAAVATPVFGRLGDMYGKRRVLLACAILMVAGSLVCALTDSLLPMVAGRTLQGLSSAVIPLGISVMRDVLPREKLSSSVALMSASLGVGGALGLPASALIAEHWNWHMLFWVSLVLGAVVTGLVALVVPESPNRAGGRLDVPGVAGLAAGLLALLLAITEGSTWGWTSPATLGCFGGSVVVLAAWGVWELRTPSPLVDLRTSARRQVLITNLASVVVGFGMYAASLIAPQILELPRATGFGLGQSLISAGLWMLPTGLVMMALSPVTGKLIRRYGAKVPMFCGALVIAAGYLVTLPLMHHAWGIMIGTAVVGAGIGLAYAAMPSLIMAAVPGSQTASANGLNSLARSIGTSLASAIIAAILSRMTIHLGGAVIPSANGFRVGLLAGGGGALIAALVVLAIPRQQPAVPRQSGRRIETVPLETVPAEAVRVETVPAEDAAPSAG